MSADEQPGPEPASGDPRRLPSETLRGSLDALASLSTQGSGLRETLTHVATLAVRAVPGAEGAGLTLIGPDRADVVVATSPFVALVDHAQYGLGQGPCITAAQEGAVFRSKSLGKDRRWPEFGQAMTRLGVHSALSLPLVTADGVLGTINIYAHGKRAFSANSEHDGKLYAISAALAVHGAQLLQDTQISTGALARAIALVMRNGEMSEAEAYHLLQDYCGRKQLELAVLAQQVIDGSVTIERRGQLGPG